MTVAGPFILWVLTYQHWWAVTITSLHHPPVLLLQHNGIDAIGAMRGEDVNSNILLSSTPYFCLRLLDFIQMREDALLLEPELVFLDQGIRVP